MYRELVEFQFSIEKLGVLVVLDYGFCLVQKPTPKEESKQKILVLKLS
tara:strand:+ start:1704 stop:1847 length:144 start_codon:yes stop_codon:yes gene_type:complete